MFSTRLPWHLNVNPLSRLVEERRAAGAVLLDLTPSNPTQVGLIAPAETLRILADPRGLRYDPSPEGPVEARRAVAEYYRGRGRAVGAERVVLTASTSEAYSFLFKLLCDPGDAVLVPRPSYPLFDYLAALDSVELIPYALGFDGAEFHLDIAGLLRALDGAPRARAVLLVNPNNPTGSFLSREEVDGLCALAAARGVALIVDEVFSDYAFAEDANRADTLVEEERALVFVLSGLSKILGLPQLKLGWICVGGPSEMAAEARARLELVADTYLSVSTPVALAAPELLAMRGKLGGDIARRVAESLGVVKRSVAGTAVTLLPVSGGWYATLRLPRTRSDEAWALLLVERAGVLVQPGYFYDFPTEGCVVVSLLTDPAILAEGMARLVALVEEG